MVIEGLLSRADLSLEAWLGSLVKAIGETNDSCFIERGHFSQDRKKGTSDYNM